MSKRNFPNFLDAYVEYMDNKHAPRIFHTWTGISTIAGALERKVWLPIDAEFSHFPNMFVFLVAHPGVGKSSALDKGTALLRELNRTKEGRINFMPTQVTEAQFINLMSVSDIYEVGSVKYYQSAAYYAASEASNSLKNLFGDFIACITDFYGCPQDWKKSTVKGGTVKLNNICFNLIAGSTFDYLSKLITNDNIMGGFASRITYVIYNEKATDEEIAYKAQLQTSLIGEAVERLKYRAALVEDLADIHKMIGAFRCTPELGAAYTEWFKVYEKARQDNPSEKMQSLLVRKPTSLFKLCMNLSAAESSERIITGAHWERALSMIENVEKDLPGMLRESKATQVRTQDGVNQAIMSSFIKGMPLTKTSLLGKLLLKGFDSRLVGDTLRSMIDANQISQDPGGRLRLLIEPDEHLG